MWEFIELLFRYFNIKTTELECYQLVFKMILLFYYIIIFSYVIILGLCIEPIQDSFSLHNAYFVCEPWMFWPRHSCKIRI